MNLYLLEQNEYTKSDIYDACIVVAEDEASARMIHPGGPFYRDMKEINPWDGDKVFHSWASSPDKVKVTLIGVAIEGTKHGVVLSSFNAG